MSSRGPMFKEEREAVGAEDAAGHSRGGQGRMATEAPVGPLAGLACHKDRNSSQTLEGDSALCASKLTLSTGRSLRKLLLSISEAEQTVWKYFDDSLDVCK